jgi:Zn-dependent M28 family amino/carboxypeptidase
MDHIPFARAGFSALSVTQVSARTGWHMHTASDRIDQLEPGELETLKEIVAALAARMKKSG